MDLTNPKVVRQLLSQYGLSPKKGYGQNFLINRSVPQRIAECSASTGASSVLEIGPGLGTLTSELAYLFDKVTAVEIDKDLIPVLSETLGEYDNVRVINADFMKTELADLLSALDDNPAVCANLPYYITTPILMRLVEAYGYSKKLPYSSITVMVQTEVANRLCAKAGSADYGAITAQTALRGTFEKILSVSPGSFIPPPKVSSSVVQLIPHDKGIYSVYPEAPKNEDECERFGERVSEVIEAAFSQRRKTLVNALAALYPKDKITEALRTLDIREDIRGEKLSALDFCRLTEKLIF